MKYLYLGERDALIREAISEFPEEFGLRGFPGKRFRFCAPDSYLTQHYRGEEHPDCEATITDDGNYDEPVLSLYVHVYDEGEGWLAFSKGRPSEFRREIVDAGAI